METLPTSSWNLRHGVKRHRAMPSRLFADWKPTLELLAQNSGGAREELVDERRDHAYPAGRMWVCADRLGMAVTLGLSVRLVGIVPGELFLLDADGNRRVIAVNDLPSQYQVNRDGLGEAARSDPTQPTQLVGDDFAADYQAAVDSARAAFRAEGALERMVGARPGRCQEKYSSTSLSSTPACAVGICRRPPAWPGDYPEEITAASMEYCQMAFSGERPRPLAPPSNHHKEPNRSSSSLRSWAGHRDRKR